MEQLGLPFTVVPSDFNEYLDDSRPPEDVAKELGLGKARAVAALHPEAIVIGSDTIVTVDGHQLGKAESLDEARDMWRIITSAPNKITTSVAVVCKVLAYERAESDNAYVYMKSYDDSAIEAYLATGDYADKAGAYSLQNATALIHRFEGDEQTILGLPMRIVSEMLKSVATRKS